MDSVLVGFSGGADSSALLHYLVMRSRETGGTVRAIHVHHGIRGEEADRDEAFCRRVCADWGVPLTVVHRDVPALAAERHRGIEETAREVRYAAFYETAEQFFDVTAIATAHNADDNAETVLFYLARGCGLDGLTGIPPITDKRVIRPLIHCTRDEIIAYCEGNTIPYIEDGTNTDLRYTRNYIRHTIMKEMKAINPDFLSAVSRMCRTLYEDRNLLDSMADDFCRASVSDARAEREKLLALPVPVLSRVLKRMYESVGGEALAYVHMDAVRTALRGERTDKDIHLPGEIAFSMAGKWACFRPREEKTEFRYPLSLGENRFDDLKIRIFLLTEPKKPEYNENIYKLSTYQRINFDKIQGEIFIRSRRDGDRYFTKKMTKSVKRWMCDSRIPRWQRDHVPLFCDGVGIAYVRGMGLRDDLKTVPGCRVLHLYLLEENPY